MKPTIQDTFLQNVVRVNGGGSGLKEPGSRSHSACEKLFLEACNMLNALREKGLSPGDELIFQFESNRNFVISLWACVLGKITPVPVAFATDDSTVRKICDISKKLNDPYIISDSPTLKANYTTRQKEEAIHGEVIDRFLVFHELRKLKISVSLPADELDVVPVGQIEKILIIKIQRYMLRNNFLKEEYDNLLERIDQSMDSIRTELTNFTRKQIENEIILIIKRITESSEKVDIYTNFLDLGITSIQMIQIKVAVEELFEHEIGNTFVFRQHSVKDLAVYIFWNVLNNNASMPVKTNESPVVSFKPSKARMRGFLEAS